jgi:hypothetical protein
METVETGSFDPETLAQVREAFDLAWAKLPREKQTAASRNALAAVVMHFAEHGETEPLRLSARALKALRWIS